MFGNNPRINPLESRKRLLVAESELNRAQLVQECVALTVGVRTLTDRARSFSTIASSAAVLMAGFAAFRRGKFLDAEVKPSWLRTILKGAGTVSTLWVAFRAKGHDQENKQSRPHNCSSSAQSCKPRKTKQTLDYDER
jgi:hypothetical protein